MKIVNITILFTYRTTGAKLVIIFNYAILFYTSICHYDIYCEHNLFIHVTPGNLQTAMVATQYLSRKK